MTKSQFEKPNDENAKPESMPETRMPKRHRMTPSSFGHSSFEFDSDFGFRHFLWTCPQRPGNGNFVAMERQVK
jgi:hypothetical protein